MSQDLLVERWKSFIKTFFRQTISFLYPGLSLLIDWTIPIQETMLHAPLLLTPSFSSKDTSPLSFRVTLEDGKILFLILDIDPLKDCSELQGQKIFHYYSLASIQNPSEEIFISSILLNSKDPAHHRYFSRAALGCKLNFQFPIVKLADSCELQSALKNNPMFWAIRIYEESQKPFDEPRRLEVHRRLLANLLSYLSEREHQRYLLAWLETMLPLPEADLTRLHAEILHALHPPLANLITLKELMGYRKGFKAGLKQAKFDLELTKNALLEYHTNQIIDQETIKNTFGHSAIRGRRKQFIESTNNL